MLLPQRQIHLDFHTSPAIPAVGADFDAREFARTMKRAHVIRIGILILGLARSGGRNPCAGGGPRALKPLDHGAFPACVAEAT